MPSYTFNEMPNSRQSSIAEQKLTRRFVLDGVHDDVTARNIAIALTPTLFENLFRNDIQATPGGYNLWYFDVIYGPVPRYGGSLSIAFDTTGGSIHVRCSKAYGGDGNVAAYDSGGSNAAKKDAGHVIGQNAEGCDMVIPVAKRSYTYRHPSGVVTESFMDYFEAITGTVNSATWHNRPAGEVLFLGATGRTTVAADCESEVTYSFAMSKNITGLTIGSITGVAKQGHDYLDLRWISAVADNRPSHSADYALIHRIYQQANFTTILGF